MFCGFKNEQKKQKKERTKLVSTYLHIIRSIVLICLSV